MAGKVTAAQISQTTLATDDFRKAVNYENPKNKGYVRFEPDGNGGVKLAKVNNKIDMFINWRTNIDAEKNKAIRDKFADSISRNLKWAETASVEKLAKSVREVAKGDKKGEARTDALSRKELQAAFKQYDDMMNTTGGRQTMINNLLKHTAERCGLIAEKDAIEELKSRFFPADEDWSLLVRMQECNTDVEAGQPGHMKMNEQVFRAQLLALEIKCDDAIQRAKIENLVRAQAETFVGSKAPDNDFGLNLSNDEKAQLRGALFHFLSAKNLVPMNNDGNAVGTCGMVFEHFVDKVLPELFKKCVNDVRAGGENVDKTLAMEANFSFDAIMEEAEKFIIGARDYINNKPEAGANLTGNAQFDAIIKSGQQTVDGANKMAKVGYINTAVTNIAQKTNITKAEAREIAGEMQQGIGTFDVDGRLGTFTKIFLAERGIGEAPADEKNDTLKNTVQSIIDVSMNVLTAAKLQHGSAKIGDGGVKVAVDNGMGDYVNTMEDTIKELATGKDGIDAGLLSELFSCTLANIANRKVELVANGASNNMQLGEKFTEEDGNLLKATADAYVTFEKGVGKAVAGAKKAFEKLARTALKKGLVTQGGFDDLVQSAASKFASAHKAALHEFFLRSPVESEAAGVKMLNRLLKEKFAVASAELNNSLAVMSLGRTLGAGNQLKLLDVEGRVKEALAQPGLDAVKVGRPGIIDEKTARARLAAGPLKRLFTETLARHLKDIKPVNGYRTLTDQNVAAIVNDFNSKVVKMLKSVAESEDKYLSACRKRLEEIITNNIDNESGVFKGYLNGPAPITTAEKKELVKNLTDETMRYRTFALRSKIGEILDAPESFGKKDFNELATATIDDFVTGGADRTLNGLVRVTYDRSRMVEGFLASNSTTDIGSKMIDKGVFGKGGPLESAGTNEKSFFIRRAVESVKKRMAAMPLVYATGDKGALMKRVIDESLEAAKAPVKGWMNFRKDFMAQIASIEADFSSLGADRIAGCRDWVLGEILADAKGAQPDLRKALEYYRQTLKGELDFDIKKVKTKFSEYVAKVDMALEPAKAKLNAAIAEVIDNLRNWMTPEAFEYLNATIIPNYTKELESEIYRNPDDFAPDKLEKIADRKFRQGFAGTLYLLFDELNTNDDNGLGKLLKIVGAEALLGYKAEMDAALADLKTWLASSDGHEKLVACEKALLDHFAEVGGASYNIGRPEMFAPTAPGNAVADFRFAVRDIVKMQLPRILYDAFNNDTVGAVKDVFEDWVDSYGLSRFSGFDQTTAKDAIMKEFAKRVKTLQEKSLDTGANEPILTPSFIAFIDQIIDSTGVEMMIGEWKTKMMSELESRYLKKDDEVGYIFDPDHPRSIKGGEPAQKVAKANREMILALLSSKISAIAGALDDGDGIDKVRESIAKVDIASVILQINDEVNTCVVQCVRRYQMEEEADAQYGRYAHSIERQLVKDAVGEELAAFFPNGLSDLLATKAGEGFVKAVGEVKAAIATFLDAAIKLCRDRDVDFSGVEPCFKTFSMKCIEEVKKSKTWLTGLFSKDGLSVALKAAAKELQAADKEMK